MRLHFYLEIIVVLNLAALMGAYITRSTSEVSSSIFIIVLAIAVFLYVDYTLWGWGVVLKVSGVHKAAQDAAVVRAVTCPPR
ncbi:hypothetical protein PR202_ga17172 [Eleusine coracana subsp. coracana]|uniref:Uncharacterized protein n=1 Tax=Eleusine coracana subsp. coracana TaxID=191504 RepID=A0AAV5CNS4_ELECO|nr:hypothetical protein PR202_ga17172 [Eleusine coracana subsp. coracana]